MEQNNISNRIKELRERKHMTQSELAIALHVKQQTIAQWEKGERDLKTNSIIDLAKYFNVSSDYLLGLSDIKTPQSADIDEIKREYYSIINGKLIETLDNMFQ